KVMVAGKAAKLEDLKAGYSVTVRYTEKDGNKIAQELHVAKPAAAKTSKSKQRLSNNRPTERGLRAAFFFWGPGAAIRLRRRGPGAGPGPHPPVEGPGWDGHAPGPAPG